MEGNSGWVVDTSASAHMSSSDGILLQRLPPSTSSILVGNGTSIPVTSTGHSILSTNASNFALNNILVAPSIVRNLLSVRQFTRDNSCSIEFDACGFSVKDLRTRRVILRCNSDGDLYILPSSTPAATTHALIAASSTLWHQRLGHPTPAALASLNKQHLIFCNKVARSICHSCQLGKHTRLPFSSSSSHTAAPFELLHCDVWTVTCDAEGKSQGNNGQLIKGNESEALRLVDLTSKRINDNALVRPSECRGAGGGMGTERCRGVGCRRCRGGPL
jgi:hypothetical protein